MGKLREALKAAEAQLRAGDSDAARITCRGVLGAAQEDAGALHRLGIIAHEQDQGALAEQLLKWAIAAAPENEIFRNNLGVVFEAHAKFAEAAAAYLAALALNPHRARVHFNLGNAMRALGRWKEAEASFRRALELTPDDLDALHNLGALGKDLGRWNEAEALFRRVLSLAPEKVDTHVQLGTLLQSSDRDEEAAACYREALRIRPGYPDALAGEASILERRGETAEACRRLLPLVENSPDNPEVATTFAGLAPHLGREEQAVRMLERVLDDPMLLLSKRQTVLFALGKLCDGLGRFPEAFRRYRQANEIHPRSFDQTAFADYSRRIVELFSAEFLGPSPGTAHPSELPIFVVGMPRSGTSLVEQILASHPRVFGAGELKDIDELSLALPALLATPDEYPECTRATTIGVLEGAAEKYLRHLRDLAPDALRVIDKMPGNFMHLGLIEMLFPRARVIHVQRDPLDTCLSCYFQQFTAGHDYSYDLRLLGHVFREYERVMAHWRRVLRVPLLEVRYEHLVHGQEEETRRLLDFCGLEWDDRCLRFHENKRVVRTASYEQVRRPMYQASVGRHRHYADFLAPLREALAE